MFDQQRRLRIFCLGWFVRWMWSNDRSTTHRSPTRRSQTRHGILRHTAAVATLVTWKLAGVERAGAIRRCRSSSSGVPTRPIPVARQLLTARARSNSCASSFVVNPIGWAHGLASTRSRSRLITDRRHLGIVLDTDGRELILERSG
jgi:hypothetical protein